MQVYVNYPKDEEGKKELAKAVADFHAKLLMEKINSLNLDKDSKKRVIKGILEKVKEGPESTNAYYKYH